jgi:tRNA U34 5-carboxymethylaminomethyl modifying GTPase MnmE/TrmE
MVQNLEYYKVFYYVSKEGSLTKAASKLSISQPAVSQAIKQLETGLGVKLLHRVSKGMKLTKEGEVLYSYIQKGFEQIVQISAKEQTGIEELYQLIQDIFFEGHVSFNDEIYLTNMRHKTEVSEALKSLAMVLQSIEDGMPEDFFSIDLLDAYEHLGFITGESVGEDLVNEIFAEFCMGK